MAHYVLLQDHLYEHKFKHYKWMDYFLKLDGLDNKIALEFAQTF